MGEAWRTKGWKKKKQLKYKGKLLNHRFRKLEKRKACYGKRRNKWGPSFLIFPILNPLSMYEKQFCSLLMIYGQNGFMDSLLI